MYLQKLQLRNFRNYAESTVSINAAKNVFLIGENGQGKTNFLEALYYISYASSFRNVKNEVLINHKSDAFSLFATFKENHSDVDTTHTLRIIYKEKKNTYFTTITRYSTDKK